MSGREDSSGRPPSPRRRLGRWIAGAIGAAALAAIVAFSSGLGNRAAENIGTSEGAPISTSVEEMGTECFAGTFLPDRAAHRTLREGVPLDWTAIEEAQGAAPATHDLIQVAIQGESERKVTLTGIKFHVSQDPRPDGAIFSRPCGGPITGRAMVVDLDATPPKITASSAEVGETVGTYPDGRSVSKPIRFPWTVSVTDPLLLEIVATTDHCDCTWTAEIPWVSGSKRGVIPVDNEGKGYTVVDGEGLTEYGVGLNGDWRGSG